MMVMGIEGDCKWRKIMREGVMRREGREKMER